MPISFFRRTRADSFSPNSANQREERPAASGRRLPWLRWPNGSGTSSLFEAGKGGPGADGSKAGGSKADPVLLSWISHAQPVLSTPEQQRAAARVARAVSQEGAGATKHQSEPRPGARPHRWSLLVTQDTGFPELSLLAASCPADSCLMVRRDRQGNDHLVFEKASERLVPGEDRVHVIDLLQRLFRNTVELLERRAEDFDTAETISGLRENAVDSESGPLSAKRVLELASRAGEEITRAVYRELPPSRAAREAPRAPTDCLVHWIAALQASRVRGSAAPVQRWIAAAKALWMSHAMTHSNVQKHLRLASDEARHHGDVYLADLALDLRQSLEGHIPPQEQRAALHDNVYGRAFESFAIESLVKNPPDSVKKAMSQLGLALGDILDAQPRNTAYTIATSVKNVVNRDRRFWFPKTPLLEAFCQANDIVADENALRALLKAPVANGYDCVAMAYLAVKFSCQAHPSGEDIVPWMEAATKNYQTVVHPAASRLVHSLRLDPHEPTAAWRFTRNAGLSMLHQPPVIQEDWMLASEKPVSRNRPDLNQLSTPARVALDHGIPYASGVSGSTNILVYLFSDLRWGRFPQFDIHAGLLGAMMFVNYDGGHSLHEALWVANQAAGTAVPELRQSDGQAEQFIANYDDFIASFEGSAGVSLREAFDTAWDKTIRHFHRHSYYSNASDRLKDEVEHADRV